ncbi:MAG: hypothetical protein PHV32_07950 [Eubacteriales bacterium]|nr:hypothetical protein [Eubacteriales bacterium]
MGLKKLRGLEELKEILTRHCRKYPELEVVDIIKLVYQNEFGCSHLLRNETEGLEWLKKEWESTTLSQESDCDDIGNGLCRLNLVAAKTKNLGVLTLNRFLLNTAKTHTGTVLGLETKLSLISRLSTDKNLPFDCSELEQALVLYRENGYPAVSHSNRYRQCYAPAYRVVKKAYCDFLPLFCKIDGLLRSKSNPIIAIEGNAASGKSTLANLLSEVNDCNIIRMDHFFLPPAKRSTERICEIGGNVDYERFYDEVAGRILKENEFSYRIFDCSKMDFRGSVKVNPLKMTVVEGAYSMHPNFGDIYDLRVFLSADFETQKSRILNRNGAEMLDKFIFQWIPKENEYFSKLHIPEKSDIII